MYKINIKHNLISLLILMMPFTLLSQERKTITGKIIDAESKNVLPYAAIGLKNKLIGTVSNEKGEFKFTFPSSITEDSLVIHYLGYHTQSFTIKDLTVVTVSLEKQIILLDEITVLPKTPEYYIQLAIRNIPNNYASSAYQPTSYYREKLSENGVYLTLDECVFKSYCEDTINQHQLLLYRKTESEAQFMKAKREKQRIKDLKKGKETEEIEDIFDPTKLFGGPNRMLKSFDLTHKVPSFIDSTNFKYYEYSFGTSTTYNNKSVIEIRFTSKRRKKKVKLDGVLYIDEETNAFVSIEYHGDLRIPVMMKPIMFLIGMRINNPKIESTIVYQEKNGLCYPNNSKIDIQLDITKKNMFGEKEQAIYNIGRMLNFNDINISTPVVIDMGKRYNSENEYESQVHNDDDMKWEEVNTVN